MTREDIIRMAREQGLPETDTDGVFIVNTDDLGRILSAEREACAKVCEEIYTGEEACGDWPTPEMCATAIRARGQA
jgi:hypothetical protein